MKNHFLRWISVSLISALVILVCGGNASGAEVGSTPQMARVPFSDRQMGNQIFRAFEGDVIETDYHAQYHIMSLSAETEARLVNAGIDYEIVEMPSRMAEFFATDMPAYDASIETIPGFDCYQTVEENYAIAEEMAADYPTLVDWIDIGDSWEKTVGLGGYDLNVLVLTNLLNSQKKPKLFLTCAIHAREYATASLCLEFAQNLVNGYDVDADTTWILDHHEVHIMLHANPDGRKHAETGQMWRKNTNEDYCGTTSEDRGADLNRNFDFYWGCCGGSSTAECSETFRGSGAGSEPETQAIQAYMRALFPDQRGDGINDPAPMDATGLYIDIHSYSELVLYPWGHTSSAPPNLQGIETLARKFAYWNHYTPEPIISLYPTSGTSSDFCYGDLGVASYGFEIGTAFFQSCSVFENQIIPDNLPALRYAAKVARTPYLTPAGPNVQDVSVSQSTVPSGGTVTLFAVVDDTLFNQSNGAEPTQDIAAAEFYVDTPPWVAGSTPWSMSAADGAFDSGVEDVDAVIDTNGWVTGRHIIFVRGQDSDGRFGAVSAVFLTIDDSIECTTHDQCDDGLFCNGQEFCDPATGCRVGVDPCPGELCNEVEDRCYQCDIDFDCDDGIFCNGEETCTDAVCIAGPAPCSGAQCDEDQEICVDCFNDSECDDGLYCNGIEACDDGTCAAGNAVDCDDGISCTADSCNDSIGGCENVPNNLACNDGLFCNGEESCDPSTGCIDGSVPCSGNCDDVLDQCVANCDDTIYEAEEMTHSTGGAIQGGWNIWSNGYAAFTHAFEEGPQEMIVSAAGEYAGGAWPNMTVTVNGVQVFSTAVSSEDWRDVSVEFDASAGEAEVRVNFTNDYFQGGADRNLLLDKVTVKCVNTEPECVNDGECDDGLFCNGQETCLAGACMPGGDPCLGSQCDEGADTCVECLNDADCDDGLFCNGEELCAQGTCAAGDAVNCDDQLACTSDSCNETANRCDHAPNDSACDDGLFCNGAESCNASTGCEAGGAPCSGERCDESLDSCYECDIDFDCDDSVYCNGEETCVSGFCQSGEDPCPGAQCDENGQICVDCVNDDDCSDGLFCNGIEQCIGGACVAGSAVECNDQIACTADGCNEATDQCDHAPNDSACDDGLFCNGEETCNVATGCENGSDPCPGNYCDESVDGCFECIGDTDCDDEVECTLDQCVNNVCQHDDSNCGGCSDDSECDDGEFCNGLETCNNGACVDGTDWGPACEQATLLSRNNSSGNFNTTSEKWFYATENINGWWSANMTGRSIYVNGQQVTSGQMPLPAPINGRRYFQFTQGQYPWAAWGFW